MSTEPLPESMKAKIQEIVWTFEALRGDFNCADYCKALAMINIIGWALIAFVIFSVYFLKTDISSFESLPVWTVGVALIWNGVFVFTRWRVQRRCEERREKLDQDLRVFGLALPHSFHSTMDLHSENPTRRDRGFAAQKNKSEDWVAFDVFDDRNYC